MCVEPAFHRHLQATFWLYLLNFLDGAHTPRATSPGGKGSEGLLVLLRDLSRGVRGAEDPESAGCAPKMWPHKSVCEPETVGSASTMWPNGDVCKPETVGNAPTMWPGVCGPEAVGSAPTMWPNGEMDVGSVPPCGPTEVSADERLFAWQKPQRLQDTPPSTPPPTPSS